MPELRKDPVIGRWIIIATERAKRPQRMRTPDPVIAPIEDCPFCPGHEGDTPHEVLSYREKGSEGDHAGWWTRVVPNKFPALQGGEASVKRVGMGMYDMVSGVGAHEVVIETPNHFESLADSDVRQVEEVLWAYRDRILELKRDERLEYILIFKNHGIEAGASLDHPHSQIIGLPIVPKRVQEEVDGARKYWEWKERCVFCDILHQEETERERIVHENDSFVAVLPYASRFPYETWILPRKHSLHFHDIQKNEVHDLAETLHGILSKLKDVLDDPPYNFIIHTAPLKAPNDTRFHWHIEIIPKLTRIAGFEWGTGFYINPLPPEQAARFLTEGDATGAEVEAEEPTATNIVAIKAPDSQARHA